MGRLIDLTGQKFGRLTVLKRDETVSSKKGAYWICQCECGNVKSIKSCNLRNGLTQSCGCLNREIISEEKEIDGMQGKKFGFLTVIKRDKTHITAGGQRKVMWLCKCDCGNTTIVTSQDLKSGHTKSCGCIPTKQKGNGIIDLTGKRFGKLVVIERVKDYTYQGKDRMMTSPRWMCKCDCGNIVIAQGGNLKNGNKKHCRCEKTTARGEIKVAEFLTKNHIKYLREYSFDDLRNKSGNLLRFDFAILNSDNNVVMLVEYQGEQHYIDCGEFGLYQRKYSDKLKYNYCKDNNLLLYEIRFDDDLERVFYDLLNKIKETQRMY